MLHLGDMQVIGDAPTAKLLKALAVIADRLHPGFDRQPNIKPLWSRKSCVMCALAVRDFLVRIGFDAEVRPVCVVLIAEKNGEQLHSAGIGVPDVDHEVAKGDWNGHMVVTVDGWLIDPTLYQAKRPAWPDLAGMMAVPLNQRPWTAGCYGLDTMAGVSTSDDDDAYECVIGWFDNPKNTGWQRGPDARDPKRRAPVIAAMVERFGRLDDEMPDRATGTGLSIPIPARLRSRPRDERGFPITYVTFLDDSGKPDFRVVDNDKLVRCVRLRLCGMCGQPLGRHLFFIGGPLCVVNRLFFDPPMHRECAIFALQACPHLAHAKGRFSKRAVPEGNFTIVEDDIASDEKCDWFALMHTTSCTLGRTSPDDQRPIIKAGKWLDVELWRDGAPMGAGE